MSYRFQKIYYTVLFTLFLACTPDYEFEYSVFVPDYLQIVEPTGIKLESNIVTNDIDINVKLEQDGTYKIKIKDISGRLVSQERVTAKAGDNLMKVYIKALPVSSYTVELLTESNQLIGKEIFAMKN